MRHVLDQRDAALVAQLLQPVNPGGVASVVHGADRLRAWRDARLQVHRVEGRALARDDLGEHRRRAAIHHRGGGRRERKRGHDHLVAGADASGQVGEVQRRGAAGERDRVTRAELRRERLLERGGAGAERQPARAQRLRDRLEVLRRQPQVEQRQLGEGLGAGHLLDRGRAPSDGARGRGPAVVLARGCTAGRLKQAVARKGDCPTAALKGCSCNASRTGRRTPRRRAPRRPRRCRRAPSSASRSRARRGSSRSSPCSRGGPRRA